MHCQSVLATAASLAALCNAIALPDKRNLPVPAASPDGAVPASGSGYTQSLSHADGVNAAVDQATGRQGSFGRKSALSAGTDHSDSTNQYDRDQDSNVYSNSMHTGEHSLSGSNTDSTYGGGYTKDYGQGSGYTQNTAQGSGYDATSGAGTGYNNYYPPAPVAAPVAAPIAAPVAAPVSQPEYGYKNGFAQGGYRQGYNSGYRKNSGYPPQN